MNGTQYQWNVAKEGLHKDGNLRYTTVQLQTVYLTMN